MSKNSFYRFSLVILGMVVCLSMPACRTCTETEYDDVIVSEAAQDTRCKLKEIIIPEMALPLHATFTDAVEFLKQAGRTYDTPWRLTGQRGVRFDLRSPPTPQPVDLFVGAASTNLCHAMFAAMSLRSISLHDALQLVCDMSKMSWHISEEGTVVIEKKVWPPTEEWATRSYTVPEELASALFKKNDGPATNANQNKVWEQFFEQLGVPRPSVRTNDNFQCTCGKTHRDLTEYVYQPVIGTLRVTNTPWNLEIIDQVFEIFASRMIEVEMQIYAFRIADTERLCFSGGLTLDSLMDLRQKGKSRLIASATAQTKSGQEAIVKAVQEVIYPMGLNMCFDPTGSNVITRCVTNALIPIFNNMRETGMILQVIPEAVQNNKMISLTLHPEWITLEGWESYTAAMISGWTYKTLSLKQPLFGVTSFETQAQLNDGETVLVGCCTSLDGEWVQAGFLTARFMGGRERSKVKFQKETVQKDEEVKKRMKGIVIPELAFGPPMTIFDAIRFFKEASIQYDKTHLFKAHRGINFVLKPYMNNLNMGTNSINVDPFTPPVSGSDVCIPLVPSFKVKYVNLYDALKLLCDVTGMKFSIRDGIVWVVPNITADEAYTTKLYPLLPSLSEIIRISAKSGVGNDGQLEWKNYFEEMGVRLSPGNSFRFIDLGSIGLLSVTSSRRDLEVVERVLEDLEVCPRMFEVDVQIHAFPVDEVEILRCSDDISLERLMELRKKGKTKPVASARVLTKAGQEACVKAVREILYPAELLTDSSSEGSVLMMPGSFVMREAGVILQVVPEIIPSDSSQISVLIRPQWITLDGWETHPSVFAKGWLSKTLPFRQPVFGRKTFETQTVVKEGQTVLLGSSSSPDGKWVYVGFLTVKECR